MAHSGKPISLHSWTAFVKTHTQLVSITAGLSLLGLLFVQVYFISVRIRLREIEFRERMHQLLLEIHHGIEQDVAASERLIRLFQQYEMEGKPLDTALQDSVLHETQFKIDSVLAQYQLPDLHFKFAFYATKGDEIVLTDATEEAAVEKFADYSERAGYRVRNALGKGKYRFGVHFPFEFWFFVKSLWLLLLGSALLIGLMALLFVSIIVAVRDQKQLSELKNEFINNLTHELKTPIFASSLIHKIAQRNLKEGNYTALSDQLALLEAENHDLKAKVEKVLQLALLENGRMEMAFQPTDLHALIQKSLRLYLPALEERGGTLNTRLSAADSSLLADPVHLGNVISNLIDNSVKYCEAEPNLHISTQNREGQLELVLKDNGKGISAQEQQWIFEKFYRASQGDIHQVKGFGLGLSYVKMVVEAHQGTIQLHSKERKGTTMTLLFPISPQKTKKHAESEYSVDGR